MFSCAKQPQDTVETGKKQKKRFTQMETSRDKAASPVTNINRDTKINWSNNDDSPRWGQGIGNPQRNEDGMILPRPSLLERKVKGHTYCTYLDVIHAPKKHCKGKFC